MLFSALITLLPATALAVPLIKAKRENVIPGKYIIKYKADVVASFDSLGITSKPDYLYNMDSFSGFASTLTAGELAALHSQSAIEYIEEDAMVTTTADDGQVSQSIGPQVSQLNAPWGLGRISHREEGNTTYLYDSSAGAGTCAYIIDTGINVSDPEFEGRATFLKDFSSEGNMKDGSGHGSHVAGTVGSKTYGVAKKAKLFAVRVLDSNGDGKMSAVIAGLEYVATDAAKRTKECPKGFVANLSLGGGKSSAINEAAAAVVKAGVFVAVSAGNLDIDAGNASPASERSVCTVGATNIKDELANFSNFGSFVDILAPGVDIISTWNNGATRVMSGTSMAAPHIAGLGAYFLSMGANATKLCEKIVSEASTKQITSVPSGTVDLLAFNEARPIETTRVELPHGNNGQTH